MLNRSVTLTPLYESGLQVFKSAFQLIGRSVTIVVDGVIGSRLSEAAGLGIFKSLLQFLTSLNDGLQLIIGSLQIIGSAGSIIINSQLGSDIGTQRFSLLQTCLQSQSDRIALASGLISCISIRCDKCLIRIIGHSLPVDSTLSFSDHVQTGVSIVTLPTDVLTVEFGLISNESHVLNTIGVVTHLGNRPRIVTLISVVYPSRTTVISKHVLET